MVSTARKKGRANRLGGKFEEPGKTDVEPLTVRLIGPAARKVQRGLMESLEQVEHGAVFILPQAPGDMNQVIRRNADEILVEGPMVDRAKTEAVTHDGLAMFLKIADDVRGVEEAELLQPADRALAAVRGDYAAAEASLMESDARLSNRVTALEGILDRGGLRFVERSAQRARGDEHHLPGRIVLAHITREDGLVPAGPRISSSYGDFEEV